MMIVFTMDEEDISRILQDPYSIVCTDGFPGLGPYHPRYTSAFIRVLEKYVKHDYLLSLQQAVHKMTGMPADKIGLKDRGHIAEKMKADIVVMDIAKIHDNSNYVDYNALADGIDYVLINGHISVDDGKFDNLCMGRVLRRQ